MLWPVVALVREISVRGGSATVAGTRSRSRRKVAEARLYLLVAEVRMYLMVAEARLYLMVGQILARAGLAMVAAERSRVEAVVGLCGPAERE